MGFVVTYAVAMSALFEQVEFYFNVKLVQSLGIADGVFCRHCLIVPRMNQKSRGSGCIYLSLIRKVFLPFCSQFFSQQIFSRALMGDSGIHTDYWVHQNTKIRTRRQFPSTGFFSMYRYRRG